MIMWVRHGEKLLLSLSPEGVRFLREQWSALRDLVRRQLSCCSTDPLAELTGLPVPTGPIDWRLACVVDYWCGTEERGPIRQVWEGQLLEGLEHALSRVLGMLPRCGGVATLPDWEHPATAEWGLMLETLYVVLDVSDRMRRPGHREGVPGPRTAPASLDNCQLSLRWLELVLDTLVQAECRTSAQTAP
ncbi:MAG: hypothetical protein ACRDTC_19130 [Pseudonocardiaceae bacterium]